MKIECKLEGKKHDFGLKEAEAPKKKEREREKGKRKGKRGGVQ